ncbi:MAG: FdhF/YdeP family oxidoreductase [Acidobacteria bacterium]|nr:FdhF/YdeP family oxidoreductase [Acidobacteriota bacterium]MBS1865818.1 FdhF/YdeP family oxidoreductase [Acidobacteriota bacterium]
MNVARKTQAQPPQEEKAAVVSSPPEVSGGIASITTALRYALGAPGIARGASTLARLNQFEGFDCPGCAWPDPDNERSVNEYCENGAKAIAEEATTKRVTPDFFRQWSVEQLSRQSDHWLGQQGRLTHPMLLQENADHYEPIAWKDAFQLIAARLNALSNPNEAIFYTSGRTSNEAAFLYQLFVREFGTNNLPDCSNMCHESSGVALKQSIGVGKGTVKLSDFDLADAIFVIGQNPGTNHPRMLTTLQRAARRGATIISVNPLSEAGLSRFKHPREVLHLLGSGTRIASHFVRVRLSGDLAFFRGVCKVLLEDEARNPGAVLAHGFVRDHTHGFEAFRAMADATPWNDIVEQSGVSREEIARIAQLVKNSKAMISCWAMGLTQQKDAVATIQEIVHMHLLRGQIGRPGAGVCPVRGHSNVQGDRTMGISERMSDSFLDSLQSAFGFAPPRTHGYDVVGSIRAMERGEAKVFFAMGGNFLSATPDTERTAAALQKCTLTVHVSTKLNRSHLVAGKSALILPCLGRTDRDLQKSGAQFVTVENSMGIVHASQGKLVPPWPELPSEPAIVAQLAQATLGSRSKVDWLHLVEDYDRIRDLISRIVPGCDDMNRKVRKPGGFYLPNAAREGKFITETGKANFIPGALQPRKLNAGQFLLTTIRSHDQFNTTIYGLDDRYRGIHGGRRVVFLNEDDMREHGWNRGEKLDITSHFAGPGGEEQRVARNFLAVAYDIPRRCAAAYFPEANVLVPLDSVAKTSNTPTSKAILVTFSRASVQ